MKISMKKINIIFFLNTHLKLNKYNVTKGYRSYSSFKLVRLARVGGNSPVRLLELRMLQSPKEGAN